MDCARVSLVGAGPGDPGLLTIKGMECIRQADVIVYDRLVHPSILEHARADAELIYVGKASSTHTMKQDDINRLLVEKAKEGKAVVRLKGGDPFVFGRGGEEAQALVQAGIHFDVVPGITSAIAVPAYAGIPVTHRGLATSLGIITGHERADPENGECPLASTTGEASGVRENPGNCQPANPGDAHHSTIRWDKIATGLDTLVFLMGVENLPGIVSELLVNGRDPSTPVALIRWGTRVEQETVTGTLTDIVDKCRAAGFEPPAITVVGEVVKLRDTLRWFDNRPLFGKKVLVTRSRDQASELSRILREQGAEPIEFPMIKVSPPESFDELDAALERVGEYDWLIFTSANGVRAVLQRLRDLDRDVRWLKGPKMGAIGPATAEAISSTGVRVDFIPSEFVAEAVVREFPEDPSGKCILIPRAKEARDVLPDELSKRGAHVDVVAAYRTEPDQSKPSDIADRIQSGEIDIITFTSSSTVKNFVALVGTSVPESVKIACIGPITAETARENGLEPDFVAEEYTIEGLVRRLVENG